MPRRVFPRPTLVDVCSQPLAIRSANDQRGTRCRTWGSHSGIDTVKEIWTAPAIPLRLFAAMSALTHVAVAAMMFATTAIMFPPIKNHRLPNISDKRPTSKKATDKLRVYPRATQAISFDGPTSSFSKVRTFEESTQPAADAMYPKERPFARGR